MHCHLWKISHENIQFFDSDFSVREFFFSPEIIQRPKNESILIIIFYTTKAGTIKLYLFNKFVFILMFGCKIVQFTL